MSIKVSRQSVLRAVGVVLRVPALFIAEAWYRNDPLTIQHHYSTFSLTEHRDEGSHEILFHVIYYTVILFCLALMVLPIRKLVNLYMYIVSAMLLGLAHYLSLQYVTKEQALKSPAATIYEDSDSIERLGLNLAAQGTICAAIAYLLKLSQWSKLLLLMYSAPMFARLVNFPLEDLHRVHNSSFVFSMLLVVVFIFNHIPVVLDLAKEGMRKMTVAMHLYGWIPFLVALWFRILLPMQFLIFWTVLFLLQLWKYCSVANHPIFAEGWIVVLLASTGECCVTPFSLLGLCITVSYMSYFVLTFTKFYLKGTDAFLMDHVMHQGWTEGFTMFLLALQTGITELKAAQRAFLMSIVLFIVLSSLIQSMFEITDPILMALGASHDKHLFRHVRAVSLCTFLWVFPIYMTFTICQFFDLDFWLMVVVSSCILTSVQVLGSLVVYALFLYDSVREAPWESLDDVVYYAKATTRVLEFVVAVFVVAYGVRESLFGEWSWVNTSILVIHCYFNVWQRLQAGWRSYLLRREAVKKIEALPVATEQQLRDLNDLCAICYQELKSSARETPCHHFYHAVCLRKWLYVQENCPMCHQVIIVKDSDQEDSDEGQEERQQQQQQQRPARDQRHQTTGDARNQSHEDRNSYTSRGRRAHSPRDGLMADDNFYQANPQFRDTSGAAHSDHTNGSSCCNTATGAMHSSHTSSTLYRGPIPGCAGAQEQSFSNTGVSFSPRNPRLSSVNGTPYSCQENGRIGSSHGANHTMSSAMGIGNQPIRNQNVAGSACAAGDTMERQ